MRVELKLPWPPSVNTYWRHPSTGALAGRHLISENGRRYRDTVAWEAKAQRATLVAGRLYVGIVAFPPDRRARDLDNVLKALLDALVHARVIADDSHIDRLEIARYPVLAGGQVLVAIESIASLP